MSSISTRRRLVRQLIVGRPIESQQEIVEMLEEEGHFVTQATVSRDLDAIGAIKVRNEAGGHSYEIPEEPPAAVNGYGDVVRIIDEFVDSIAISGNMLVFRTRPGAAHVVGSAIDRAHLEGVLGTIAGDDTLLVVATEEVGGRGVTDELSARGVHR